MKRRACIVVASEMTVRAFLCHQLAAMEDDYDVTVVVNTRNHNFLNELGLNGCLFPIHIQRSVSVLKDLKSLIRLARFLRRGRFDIVHSFTPKAGLLAMVGGWLARIPVRVHTFTGQVWATRAGIGRAFLKNMDRLTAASATLTLADSSSQRDFLLRERVVSASKSMVLGKGSLSGVDGDKFRPDFAARQRLRGALGIPLDSLLLLFVGRLNRDKGVLDLAHAFVSLAGERHDVRLLLVGPDEEGMRRPIEVICGPHLPRVSFLDFTNAPEAVMAAADVLCLPSYREGFGSVIIEAAAAGAPAVASRIYGVIDAVEEGRTGLLHQAGAVDDLTAALRRVVVDVTLRRSLGAAARTRALEQFSQGQTTAAVLDLYARLLPPGQPRGSALSTRRHRRLGS